MGEGDTYATTEELEVTSTLRVAVACAVLSTSLVSRLRGDTAISGHRDEVKGGVDAASDSGQVDIEGKFVADKVERLIGLGVLHQVHTGTNVGTELVLGDEAEVKRIARGGDTICVGVVRTLSLANLSTLLVAGAGIGPLVSVIAVGRVLY